MRNRIATPLLFFTVSAAFASSAPDHWLRLRSEHFIVLTNSDAKDARRIASQFERMRSVFATLIPTAKSGNLMPITVLALKDKKSFQAIEPAAYLAKGSLDLDGLFLRTPDQNYILVRLDDSDRQEHPFSTVYHEYTHLLNSKFEALPLWLNEGLAEFYQNTDINDKNVRLGQPSPNDIYYLRDHSLIPIATLVTIDHNSPYYHDEQKGSVFYAESWALTHYLFVNDRRNNTHLLNTYLVDIAHGQDSVTAAQHAWGDLKSLDKALGFYVSQGSFSQFELPIAFKVDESTFKIEPLSTSDANAVRADVLVYDDRKPEALALLETTLRDDPGNALAHQTMGFLKFRDGDVSAARKWYDEAVQLGSQSYLAYYYSAVFALGSGNETRDDAIESNLRTAIKLNPLFAPSYDALAHLYDLRHEKLDDAHTLVNQAIQLDPDNVNFRLNASSILMAQQDPKNAINVLDAAEKIAKNPTERAVVADRRRQIQAYMAQMAQGSEHSTSGVSPGPPEPGTVTTQTQIVSLVHAEDDTAPRYPTEAATGPHRTVKGVIDSVNCYFPAVLALSLNQAGKTLPLYALNYYKVEFYQMNFTPAGDLHPCTDIKGLKATITYVEQTDPIAAKQAAGQVLRVELSK